jgi:arylsulfatase A
VVSGDGRWKLQLPHTYRTLGGQPGGHGGIPVPYEKRKLERAELNDLVNDVSEVNDVAGQHADVVKRLEAEAGKARHELGDGLTKQTGQGVREPGRVAQK